MLFRSLSSFLLIYVYRDDHPAGQQGGMISKKESVEGILEVLQGKTIEHSGTAWKYDGTVGVLFTIKYLTDIT